MASCRHCGKEFRNVYSDGAPLRGRPSANIMVKVHTFGLEINTEFKFREMCAAEECTATEMLNRAVAAYCRVERAPYNRETLKRHECVALEHLADGQVLLHKPRF